MPDGLENTPVPARGSAKRPVAGMIAAFVIVVLIVVLGASYLFRGHTASAPVSTAGSAVNETNAVGDSPGRR